MFNNRPQTIWLLCRWFNSNKRQQNYMVDLKRNVVFSTCKLGRLKLTWYSWPVDGFHITAWSVASVEICHSCASETVVSALLQIIHLSLVTNIHGVVFRGAIPTVARVGVGWGCASKSLRNSHVVARRINRRLFRAIWITVLNRSVCYTVVLT